MPQTPTVGRTVLYTLHEGEADALAKEYEDQIGRRLNRPQGGQEYPAVIVAVWSDTCVNLVVQLDGVPVYWATSRSLGDGDGRWAWPVITPAAAPVAAEPDKD